MFCNPALAKSIFDVENVTAACKAYRRDISMMTAKSSAVRLLIYNTEVRFDKPQADYD